MITTQIVTPVRTLLAVLGLAGGGMAAVGQTGTGLTGNYYDTRAFSTRMTTRTADDGAPLWVDDQLIVQRRFSQTPPKMRGEIRLKAGQRVNLRLEFIQETRNVSQQPAPLTLVAGQGDGPTYLFGTTDGYKKNSRISPNIQIPLIP
jgi:hypothetical protein